MKLSAPLRVTWDWNWPPVVREGRGERPAEAAKIRPVAEDLARAMVLLLEIGYPGIEDLRSGLVAEVLRTVPSQSSLILDPEFLAHEAAESLLGESGAVEIWADVTPLPGGAADLPRRPDGSLWPDLRIYLTALNRGEATAILEEALGEGCRRLSLPILPLFGSFLGSPEIITPAWRDLVEFTDRLEPLLAKDPGLDLRVHNQALWTILRERGIGATEAEAPGHKGCQAASALAYIDPGGTLYPCAALPVPLGRMGDHSLGEIWASEECRGLREAIETVPSACGACSLWESCRGGCRGWAHFLGRTWREPGPDCGRPAGDSRSPE